HRSIAFVCGAIAVLVHPVAIGVGGTRMNVGSDVVTVGVVAHVPGRDGTVAGWGRNSRVAVAVSVCVAVDNATVGTGTITTPRAQPPAPNHHFRPGPDRRVAPARLGNPRSSRGQHP